MDLLIFGYFATFFSAVSFLPQAIKTIKTRDVTGLSLLTYICLFLASLSWFTYGVVLNDIPLMATYFLTTFPNAVNFLKKRKIVIIFQIQLTARWKFLVIILKIVKMIYFLL